MDLDEPVNVDMEPDEALRVLLGDENGETEEDQTDEVATD